MSKYDAAILSILKKDEIMSTREILQELESRSKRVINWHALYRILMELVAENKVERFKAKAGFFWKKK